MISSTLLFSSVEEDLRLLTENLKQLVGARHPILYAAAEYLFGTKGKRVRPRNRSVDGQGDYARSGNHRKTPPAR